MGVHQTAQYFHFRIVFGFFFGLAEHIWVCLVVLYDLINRNSIIYTSFLIY